jgi:hypothetical protein
MVGCPVKPWERGEMIAAEVLSAIEMDAGAVEAVRGVEASGVTGEEATVDGPARVVCNSGVQVHVQSGGPGRGRLQPVTLRRCSAHGRSIRVV